MWEYSGAMRWIIWGMLPLLFLFACANRVPTVQSEPLFDFSHWRELPKLNSVPMYSESHRAYIDIYANNSGKKAYESKVRLYPVGAEIVKPLYTDKKGKVMTKLTVMVKMHPGYDPENGDWWYGVYNNEGTIASHYGRIESCIKCHKIAADTDYLFADSVMDEIAFFREMGE